MSAISFLLHYSSRVSLSFYRYTGKRLISLIDPGRRNPFHNREPNLTREAFQRRRSRTDSHAVGTLAGAGGSSCFPVQSSLECVRRAGHRTHQEEFNQVVEVPDDLAIHNTLLRRTIREPSIVSYFLAGPEVPDPEGIPRLMSARIILLRGGTVSLIC